MGIFRTVLNILAVVFALVVSLVYIVANGGDYASPLCQYAGVDCPNKVVVDGYTSERYKELRQVYQKMFDEKRDVASCFAVYENNELVVDLCGGYMDGPNGSKAYRNGLQNVFSCSKAVTSIIFSILVDRGLVEYEKPIAHYWPDFAQGGKENVTVTDLLQHAGGVTWLDEGNLVPEEYLTDETKLDDLAKVLARQPHNYASKRTTAYHTVVGGLYLNELVRRVDDKHRGVNQFIQEEFVDPLGIEFTLGLPEKKEDRFSPMLEYPKLSLLVKHVPRIKFDLTRFGIPQLADRAFFQTALTPSSTFAKSTKLIIGKAMNVTDDKLWRQIKVISSAGGFTNAKSMAKIGHIMAMEGEPVDGVTFFKNKENAKKANTEAGTDFDHTLLKNVTRTWAGFGKMVPGSDVTGWVGLGGSVNVWSPKKKYSFAYVPKARGFGMGVDKRPRELLEAFEKILNKN